MRMGGDCGFVAVKRWRGSRVARVARRGLVAWGPRMVNRGVVVVTEVVVVAGVVRSTHWDVWHPG